MHRGDLVLELRIVDDDPRVAEFVLAAFELGAGVGRDPVQELLEIVLGADEVAGRKRLEADAPRPGRAQPQLGVERDRGGRQREQPLARRAGELLSPEQDVTEPQGA